MFLLLHETETKNHDYQMSAEVFYCCHISVSSLFKLKQRQKTSTDIWFLVVGSRCRVRQEKKQKYLKYKISREIVGA